MITQMQERPPYVMFEIRTQEDRDATIKAGRYIAKDVDFVVITPAGSKDTVERKAEDWIEDINRKASMSPPSYNPAHVNHFNAMYKAWKDKQTLPETGTPIKGWPVISPAEQENILSANVRTVEDLALLNESGLTRVGMGARALQNKAKAWIESANDHGKVSAEVSALKVKAEEQERRIEDLIEANKTLMAKLGEEPRQKRAYNRKPKNEPIDGHTEGL